MRVCAWLTVAVVLWGPLSGLKGGETPALPGEVNQAAAPAESKSAAEWKRQLRAWLGVLREAHRTGDDSADDLKERIRKIRDPNALAGLEAVVSEGRDYPRLYFLEPLAKIGSPRAMKTLVEVCATDTNPIGAQGRGQVDWSNAEPPGGRAGVHQVPRGPSL